MAVSYALFFGALALLAALIVPQLVQSVTTFAGRLGAYEETIRGLLVWVQNTFGIDTATAEQLVQMVGTALQNWFGGLSHSAARAAADFVSGAAGAAGNAVVALAASIYLLSGKEALLRAARACLHAALPPRAAGSVLEICRLANKIFSGYIGGQLVDALLVGGETFALMSIFGLEYAPLLAVLVGVTNIVPVLGPFLGAVPGLIILLLELPWKAAEFAIIILWCSRWTATLLRRAFWVGPPACRGWACCWPSWWAGRGSASRAWCWACRRWPCWRRCSNRLSGQG